MGIDSRPSSAPRTRDHSVDTEMLSLAGEVEAEMDAVMDLEDELLGQGSKSHGNSSHYQRKMLDSEMDDFLAE